MAGTARHIFTGTNTPEGFFSYDQYILGHDAADKIICIKGGPRSGKSVFMKKIGESMLEDGCDVDFIHCADHHCSLDGILLRDKKIAMIDGTSPPFSVDPGAVDSVIHLGDYWNESGVENNRDAFAGAVDKIRDILGRAYNYFAAAVKMYDNLSGIYESALLYEKLYRITAEIIGNEFAHHELSSKEGGVGKYFVSAITAAGFENYIDTLAESCQKVYLIQAPVGLGSERLLTLFMEGALCRGFRAEGYYCPMKPAEKLEHLLIPELRLAFLTSNQYHTIDRSAVKADVTSIDLSDVIRYDYVMRQKGILADSKKKMDELLEKGIYCLGLAKEEQDEMEKFYVPTMDFFKIDALRKETAQKFSQR